VGIDARLARESADQEARFRSSLRYSVTVVIFARHPDSHPSPHRAFRDVLANAVMRSVGVPPPETVVARALEERQEANQSQGSARAEEASATSTQTA
jgi:hypothetical protein